MRWFPAACLVLLACHSTPATGPLPVRLVTVPSRTVVSLAGKGDRDAGEKTFNRLLDRFERQGLTPAGFPMLVVSRDGRRHAAMVPVLPGVQPEPPLVLRHLPEFRAAAVVLIGTRKAIPRRFAEIEQWIEDHGLEVGETRIEVRGTGERRTEVLIPVRPARGSGPLLP